MNVINRPFVGVPSFLRARVSSDPADVARAAIAVLGVPFDEGSPFLPGSRMGPRAIREPADDLRAARPRRYRSLGSGEGLRA